MSEASWQADSNERQEWPMQGESTAAFFPASKMIAYASAHECDISAETFKVVENGEVWVGYVGTVYTTMVGTDKGYKFKTFAEARDNAARFVSQCREAIAEKSKKLESDN